MALVSEGESLAAGYPASNPLVATVNAWLVC